MKIKMKNKMYNIGDIITFGLNRPSKWNKKGKMDKYLGKTFIITDIYYTPFNNDGTFQIYNPFNTLTLDSRFWSFWLSDIKESNTINFPKFDYEIFKTNNKMNTQQRKQAIHDTANALCNANNTFTTLELKNELRKIHPNEIWNQIDVSIEMMDLSDLGHFDFIHTGTHRVYSAVPSLQASQPQVTNSSSTMVSQLIAKAQTPTTPTVAMTAKVAKVKPALTTKRIGRTKALEIIKNTNGKFFSVRFEKKNGDDRLMGVQYVKGTKPDPLGYVLLKDLKAKKSKSVNLQTLSEIKTNNILYKVK